VDEIERIDRTRDVLARPDRYDAYDVTDRPDAGIDVRILVDRYPVEAAATADVCVPGDRVDEARRILHIEL
jgi:hypothetical protein